MNASRIRSKAHFDWTRRITDMKPFSGPPGRCAKCGRKCGAGQRVRFTFTRLDKRGWFDKLTCHPCADGIMAGRSFNVFAAEDTDVKGK